MKGSWALITGASSGIGAATARALAQQGVSLILVARRLEQLKVLAESLRQVEVRILDLDIRSDLRPLKNIPEINLVDILINNAGLAKGVDKFQDAKLEDCEQMFATNVDGLMKVTRLVLPAMIKNRKGHVVNVGSVAGRWVYPGGAVYCATKFAVRALSEGLRMDLAGTGVRVTNIEPGMVATEFSNVRLGDDEKAKVVYSGMNPLLAEDIAETIVWSLSRPQHVNIQEMVIFPTDQSAIGMVHRK